MSAVDPDPVDAIAIGLDLEGVVRPVGRLEREGRRIGFTWDQAFLDDPLPLSPLTHPARPGAVYEKERPFQRLPGLVHDSLPDGWGWRLISEAARRRGDGWVATDPMKQLAWIADRGMGALTYAPDRGRAALPRDVDLPRLARYAADFYRSNHPPPRDFPGVLVETGAAPAGVVPKALLAYHPETGALRTGVETGPGWVPALTKFELPDAGVPDWGAMEFTYAEMARLAGIEVADTWLIGATDDHPGYFTARRFDRSDRGRLHMHSFSGLVRADRRVPCADYTDLFKATWRLTHERRDVARQFARMVFNALAHNRDDHSRNTAFLMDRDGRWRLAPAYDLTFSEGPDGHWMTVAGASEPNAGHIAEMGRRAKLPPQEIAAIVERVRAAVDQWPALSLQFGVGRALREEVGERLRAVDRAVSRGD